MDFYDESWKKETSDINLLEEISGEFFGDPNGQDFSIDGAVFFGSTLQVIGVSTFSNGPVIAGSGSSTGTPNQTLQVTGGAYIGGSVGIGTTNPGLCGQLEVVGTICATDFNSTSDVSLKTNLKIIPNSLDKVLNLNGYTFNWRNSNKKSAGVVAQELEKILPELVGGFQQKTVNYNGIIALLIESIKELNAKIENLTNELESVKMSK